MHPAHNKVADFAAIQAAPFPNAGFALTNVSDGMWQYSIDGSAWNGIDPTTLSDTNALLLGADYLFRHAGEDGKANFSGKVWDPSDGTKAGTYVDLRRVRVWPPERKGGAKAKGSEAKEAIALGKTILDVLGDAKYSIAFAALTGVIAQLVKAFADDKREAERMLREFHEAATDLTKALMEARAHESRSKNSV